MNLARALLAITFGLVTAVAGAEPPPMKLQPKKASERVYYFEGEPAMASSAVFSLAAVQRRPRR